MSSDSEPSQAKQVTDLTLEEVIHEGGIEDVDGRLKEAAMTNLVDTVSKLTWLFMVANGVVAGIVLLLFAFDQINLCAGMTLADERIINTQVVLALIGATVAEVASILILGLRSVSAIFNQSS